MNSFQPKVATRLFAFFAAGWLVVATAPYAAGQAVVERRETVVSPFVPARSIDGEGQKPPTGTVAPTLEKIRFTATSSAAEVLPFQTVRIRQRLENVSSEPIGPLPQLHDPRLEIKMEGEETPRFSGYQVAGRVPISMIVCGHFPERGYRRELFLTPGQSTSVSVPLVTFGRRRPFFERPGELEVIALYTFGPINANSVPSFRTEAKIAVRAAEPQGVDRLVYDELSRQPEAAFALTGYDYEVAEEAVPVLERLLREHPTSSYGDYIRLALARGLWGSDAPGSNESPHLDVDDRDSRRGYFGRLTTQMNWIYKNDHDPNLRSHRRHSLLTSDFHSADLPALRDEFEAAGQAPVPLKQLNDKLATMSGTSRERRERIVALLRGIDRERFPLAPVVTYHLARTLSIDDPIAAADEYVRLAQRHADAFEWLYRLEIGALTADDWVEYRLTSPKP